MNEDIRDTPYARWLEELCELAMDTKPVVAGVCMMGEDGEVVTGYFGGATHEDKAVMAHYFNTDAMMAVVMANAGDILAAAEEDNEEEA